MGGLGTRDDRSRGKKEIWPAGANEGSGAVYARIPLSLLKLCPGAKMTDGHVSFPF
jgi:hypothetical protein